jgi:hypothetical protein
MTDLDNDGIADVIWNGRHFLWVFRGTGDGQFKYMNKEWGIKDLSAASVDDGHCFGDINGDGMLDISGYTTASDRRQLPHVGDAFFRAKLGCVVNPGPLEKFFTLVSDFGQQGQAPSDPLNVIVRPAFVERNHFRCQLNGIALHGASRPNNTAQQGAVLCAELNRICIAKSR